jgi:Zn-finger nucleic acid-binding protein
MEGAGSGGPEALRLVACQNCHTQYDVTEVIAKSFPCRCGETVENRSLAAVDATVHRCGSCGAIVSAEAERCAYCGSDIVRDPGNLSLICPECYARSSEDSRFCTACGVAFRPEQVRIEGHELPCPDCTVLMPPHQVGGVGVNECRKCNGLWVPGENFELLVSRAIEARRGADPAQLVALKPRVTGSNPAAQRVQYRKCPVCDAFMLRRNFRKSSGVIIDTCHAHGTWLDADELEEIAGFILSGGQIAPSLAEGEDSARLNPRAAAQLARLYAEERSDSSRDRNAGGFVGSLVEVLTGLLS